MPRSEAHKVLQDAVNNPANLKTLRMLNHGMHTGTLENVHSLILAYAPKRLDFDPPGYNARVKLAVIDHNRNVGRGVLKGMCNNDCFQHFTLLLSCGNNKCANCVFLKHTSGRNK